MREEKGGERTSALVQVLEITLFRAIIHHTAQKYTLNHSQTHTHTHTHTHTEWSSYAGSGLVGLVGEGVGFVRDKGASGRVLQHDTADHTDTHHQSIIWSCKPHIQVLNQLPPSSSPSLPSFSPSLPLLPSSSPSLFSFLTSSLPPSSPSLPPSLP